MEKRKIVIALFALVVLVLIVITGLVIRNGLNSRQTPTPVPTMTPTAVIFSTPTPFNRPTPTPTVSSVWIVEKVKIRTIKENGFNYDVYLFRNESVSSLTLEASCMAPSWPSPKIGEKYTLNKWGVLVPLAGIDSPLQRFNKLK